VGVRHTGSTGVDVAVTRGWATSVSAVAVGHTGKVAVGSGLVGVPVTVLVAALVGGTGVGVGVGPLVTFVGLGVAVGGRGVAVTACEVPTAVGVDRPVGAGVTRGVGAAGTRPDNEAAADTGTTTAADRGAAKNNAATPNTIRLSPRADSARHHITHARRNSPRLGCDRSRAYHVV
jgi:hypothetical protein